MNNMINFIKSLEIAVNFCTIFKVPQNQILISKFSIKAFTDIHLIELPTELDFGQSFHVDGKLLLSLLKTLDYKKSQLAFVLNEKFSASDSNLSISCDFLSDEDFTLNLQNLELLPFPESAFKQSLNFCGNDEYGYVFVQNNVVVSTNKKTLFYAEFDFDFCEKHLKIDLNTVKLLLKSKCKNIAFNFIESYGLQIQTNLFNLVKRAENYEILAACELSETFERIAHGCENLSATTEEFKQSLQNLKFIDKNELVTLNKTGLKSEHNQNVNFVNCDKQINLFAKNVLLLKNIEKFNIKDNVIYCEDKENFKIVMSGVKENEF